MIEAEFGLFQAQQKGAFGHAFELLEAGFGKAPEGLDAVDVRSANHKFVLPVAGAKVAVEAPVHQPVVAAAVPTVRPRPSALPKAAEVPFQNLRRSDAPLTKTGLPTSS